MQMKILYGGIAFLVLLLLVAGCTQPAAQQATPVPTTEAVTEAPTAVETATTAVPTTVTIATPGPTQTLQSNWAVDVQVASNGQAIDPEAVLTFRGGKGINYIPEIDLILYKEDGTIENDKMVQPLYVGKTVQLKLSSASELKDRAEVWVITPQGDRVKVIDQYVPFRSYN